MRTTSVLFVVTAFASMTISASGVPVQEEQYRAKYGRYSPAFHAQPSEKPVATPACCGTLPAVHPLRQASLLEEKYRAKTGRYSPAGEWDAKAAHAQLAKNGENCRVQQQCPIKASVSPAAGTAALQIAKYGRSFPVRPQSDLQVASTHSEPCEHACCQQAE